MTNTNNNTQELTLVFAAQKGLSRVKNVLAKRKGTKYLHMAQNQKTLLGIMIERFENFGKVEDPNTLFGCGFVMSIEVAAAFGYKLSTPLVFTLDTAICSEKINIIPMCQPSEFLDNKK